MAAALASPAAEIATEDSSLFIRGRIESGDAEKLARYLLAHRRDVPALKGLGLSSPGGSVAEAARLAQLLEALLLRTTVSSLEDLRAQRARPRDRVPKRSVCASSCFLVWLAGYERSAGHPWTESDRQAAEGLDSLSWEFRVAGPLGLHRPFVDIDEASFVERGAQQRDAVFRLGQYLRARGVSESLIAAMMQATSRQVHWLDEREIQQLEHRVDYEEFIVQQCGYIRPAAQPGDEGQARRELAAVLDNIAGGVQDCAEAKFAPVVRRERRAVLDRLATGWRPWQVTPPSAGAASPP